MQPAPASGGRQPPDDAPNQSGADAPGYASTHDLDGRVRRLRQFLYQIFRPCFESDQADALLVE